MGLRHMRVVYKSPDCYEMVVVAGKQIGAPMRVSLGTQPGSSHPGGGAAVLLWPRSATITKRVQLPPTAGDRLLSACVLSWMDSSHFQSPMLL
jgi:hypothetical protein